MRLDLFLLSFVLWGLTHLTALTLDEQNLGTLFSRLKRHEMISLTHRQLRHIDGSAPNPIYPNVAILEFTAYGQHYKIQMRKNEGLIPENGLMVHRYSFDHENNQEVTHITNYTRSELCFYNGEVISDTSGKSLVILSACRGDGIQGWIQAFGEQLFIKPARLLTDPDYRGKHLISDQHIVYRDSDVHSIDKPPRGHTCGHDHPKHAEWIENDRKNGRTYMLDESYSNLIHNEIISSDIARNNSRSRSGAHDHSHSSEKTERRRLASTTNRYVELLVVNDVPRYQYFLNKHDDEADAKLLKSDLAIVNQVATLYLSNDFGNVGSIHVVLSKVVTWTTWTGLEAYKPAGYKKSDNSQTCDPTSYCSSCSNICEASYDDYLSNFHQWRTNKAPSHDNAQLFSYFDFLGSVIGYATLPGMCIQQSSGGIEQATYDDAYNGNILAHEMGHNWKMSHDSANINDCDPNAYIMSAVGDPNGARPTEFSECSVASTQDFFSSYSSTLACVNNLPSASQYAICGNGFIEQGETCDCGGTDCSTTDPCCDGELCQLYVDAECSSNDVCCSDCHFKAKGTICRALDQSNSCDIEEERCDGKSSTCPTDTFKIEGENCANNTGYCYNGRCVSIEDQCEVKGDLYASGNYIACTNYGNTEYPWKTPTCDKLKCVLNSGGSCSILSASVTYDKGTPCTVNSSHADLPAQCYNGQCSLSSKILTYKWKELAWGNCSKPCLEDGDTEVGIQNRSVICTLQNGVEVDVSLCNDSKPVTGRYCNNYECDFCREGSDGQNICEPNGSCNDEKKKCDCDYGYDGKVCDITPGLKWIGVTRRVFVRNGVTYAWRVDPYQRYNVTNNSNSVVTVIVPDEMSITNLTLGDTISLRWNSTGKLQYLAVGIWDRNPDSWVRYVGKGLAIDNQLCDREDPYLIRSECDDFSFQIPEDLDTGVYEIVVRFNNDYTMYSGPLYITCSDDVCNSTGNGVCASNQLLSSNCACSNDWFGALCDENLCLPWSFAKEGGDAYSAPVTFPRCVNVLSDDACDPAATSVETLCDCKADSGTSPTRLQHYDGTYCEVPVDRCSSLSQSNCASESTLCSYTAGNCLYNDCRIYGFDECGESPDLGLNDSFPTNYTWNCEWDSDITQCVRKSCPIQTGFECARGSVRRPLYDTHSICDYWYCDCSTASDADSTYYKIPTQSELSDVDFNALSSGSDTVNMLTCNLCSLECDNGASPDAACTSCGECPYPWGGLLCDQKYWVISMRLKVDWQTAYAFKKEEFESLFTQDMAYVVGVSQSRLGVWQSKGNDGETVVYWTYTFLTGDDSEAQAEGGSIFAALKTMVAKEGSPVYRGWLSNSTDSEYTLEYCIPSKEECDPGQQFDYLLFFGISVGVAFLFNFISLAVYRFLTRKKRRERYEAKLREVREHQMRTMESHARARRVGLKDVSKSRASEIYHAKQEKKKVEEQELKDRVKEEKEMQRRVSMQKHNPQRSQEELQQRLIDTNASAPPPAFADPAANLPPGWQVFYNSDNIPYYYNANTGITSWRPPSQDDM